MVSNYGYGFLGEPMGFKRCKMTGKLAPTFKHFHRWAGFDDEHYESDEPKTVAELTDVLPTIVGQVDHPPRRSKSANVVLGLR